MKREFLISYCRPSGHNIPQRETRRREARCSKAEGGWRGGEGRGIGVLVLPHRSLDHVEDAREKLIRGEAALGGTELLGDGLHVASLRRRTLVRIASEGRPGECSVGLRGVLLLVFGISPPGPGTKRQRARPFCSSGTCSCSARSWAPCRTRPRHWGGGGGGGGGACAFRESACSMP